MGGVGGLELGVEERLADYGDDTHERAGVGVRSAAATVVRGFGGHGEGNVLERVRAHDGFIGIAGAKGYKGAAAPDHASVWNDIGGGESFRPQGFELFGVRVVAAGHPELGGYQ